ncbi:MAG: FMN-binding protein [Bacteroidales bacterium]
MKFSRLHQFISLITCLLLMLTVSINRDGRVLGRELSSEDKQENNKIVYEDRGYIVISTEYIAKDITGYGGAVPLHIFIKDNRIVKIEPQPNSESPDYFKHIIDKKLLSVWVDLSPKEALAKDVDAVSGATYSSSAIIETVKRAMAYIEDTGVNTGGGTHQNFNLKFAVTVIVILSAMFLPLFIKNRRYRILQQVLNIIVIGFWSGSFISLSLIINYLSNGINIAVSLIAVLLLSAAFIMPLFGKKSHYCNWICPLGAFQELISGITPFKINIPQKIIVLLTRFRELLWFAIMFIMWIGVGFSIIDYEPFSAFLFRTANVPVIIICSSFLLLSFLTPRPFCRFVCLTGTLLKMSERSK